MNLDARKYKLMLCPLTYTPGAELGMPFIFSLSNGYPSAMSIVIGVISDTHGLLRPEAVAALRGVEMILHAGDVGGSDILDELGAVAPVVAVRGNNDKGNWAEAIPEHTVVDISGVLIYMLHDIKELRRSPQPAGSRVVIFGHSHRPLVETRDGVLHLNPGSAGPRRFSLPTTVALLRIGDDVAVEVIHLLADRKEKP